MLIFESGCVVEVVGSPRKRACMLIFEGRGGDGVGKEQLPSKTRLVFEDKEFSPPGHVGSGVWCDEDGTPRCVVMPPNVV